MKQHQSALEMSKEEISQAYNNIMKISEKTPCPVFSSTPNDYFERVSILKDTGVSYALNASRAYK